MVLFQHSVKCMDVCGCQEGRCFCALFTLEHPNLKCFPYGCCNPPGQTQISANYDLHAIFSHNRHTDEPVILLPMKIRPMKRFLMRFKSAMCHLSYEKTKYIEVCTVFCISLMSKTIWSGETYIWAEGEVCVCVWGGSKYTLVKPHQ